MRNYSKNNPLSKNQKKLSEDARNFYNSYGPGGGHDRNYLLSRIQLKNNELYNNKYNYTNHHYGIGNIQIPLDSPQALITQELHRLEMNQIDVLIAHMNIHSTITSSSILLDAGSGRGGTALRVWESCHHPTIHGVTVAEDQCKYSNDLMHEYQIDNVNFYNKNMLLLENNGDNNEDSTITFNHDTFDHIYQNETDMYILDLNNLYQVFRKLLKQNGIYTMASWVCTEKGGRVNNPYKNLIDKNYDTDMHIDIEIFEALNKNGFNNIKHFDYTDAAMPYWLLRDKWEHRSGVEEPFIQGYEKGFLKYMFVTAVNDK